MRLRRRFPLRRRLLLLVIGWVGVAACLAAAAAADEAPKKPPAKPAKEAPKKAPKKAPEPAPAPEEEATDPDEPPPRELEFPDDGVIERADGTILFFYRTNFVTPKDLKNSLSTLLKVPGVTFQEFLQQNVLLMEGEPDAVELALEAAGYFDVSVPQVFIEAKVIEITYDSNFEFGLDYLWSRDQVGPDTLFRGAESILNPTSFIGSTLPGSLPFQGTSLLWGLVGSNAEKFGLLDVTLQALQHDGKAEVLSKPSIICSQNTEASVKTTEDRQIIQLQRADTNNTTYQPGNLTTGVTLKVKPTHIGDQFVTMKVDPEVKGLQGVSALGTPTLRPIITTRSASTTVTMADGETLVIGGLYTNHCVTSKAKTPLISDIPVLGELFTRTQETKAKTELIFMLTPRIVRRTSELKVITPPAELERLEGEAQCWRPAGPSLTCPPECIEKEEPKPPPCYTGPRIVTSTPSSNPGSLPTVPHPVRPCAAPCAPRSRPAPPPPPRAVPAPPSAPRPSSGGLPPPTVVDPRRRVSVPPPPPPPPAPPRR